MNYLLDTVTTPWAASSTQEWAFFRPPNGYYAIMNAKTTLFLQVQNNFAYSTQVDQAQWSASLFQMWYLYPLGNHVYAIVNVANGLMLADPNNATSSGNPVEPTQWEARLNQI
jgi:hypothetical protein